MLRRDPLAKASSFPSEDQLASRPVRSPTRCGFPEEIGSVQNSASPADLTASDHAHLTEKGSIFLVGTIIDRVLGQPAAEVMGASRPSRDAPGLDVENLPRRPDLAECHGVGAGQPDLCAEPGQFIE